MRPSVSAATYAGWCVPWKAASRWSAWTKTLRPKPGRSAQRKEMTLLIRNGTVVNADRTFSADLRIEGEKIHEVGPNLTVSADDGVIDASGMLLLPGGIDAHTHLDMPFGGTTSSDDFETGTRAAAF